MGKEFFKTLNELVLETDKMREFMRKRSDYYPEIYLHSSAVHEVDRKVIWLGTFTRYLHIGAGGDNLYYWYKQFHMKRHVFNFQGDLERKVCEWKMDMAKEVYFTIIAGGGVPKYDMLDEIQIDEKLRLVERYVGKP